MTQPNRTGPEADSQEAARKDHPTPPKPVGPGRKFILSLVLGLIVGLAGIAGAVLYLTRSLG